MQESNQAATQSGGITLDIYSILRALVKDWWMILTAALLGAMVAYVMANSAYTPTYTSSMTFIVSSKGSTGALSDLNAANEMAETFGEVLNSRLLKKRVQQELELGYLPGTISTNIVEQTNLMTLSVSAPSPEHAFRIMKSVLNNYSDITQHVLADVVLDVLEAPKVPTAPSNPISASNMMKEYALLSAVLMAGLLALINYLKDDIKNVKEVESKLDTNLLGTIYHETKNKTFKSRFKKNKKALLVTDQTTGFMFVENYKKLRTKVMYKTRQNEGKVILITSVMENEGKSTVAANLALTLAQKSSRVILVDGDMRRPAMYKIMEKKLTKEQEIGEYLKGNIPLKEVIHHDKEKGLYLLIGSKHYSNSTELISGERLRNLMKAVRESADYVVIDSPPTSLMADAEVLAEYADVSILVVRQGMATARFINDTIDILENGRSELLGCVYNDVKTGVFSERHVFGGYRYGYGRYGRYGKYGRYGRYGYGKYGYGKYGYGKYAKAKFVKPEPEDVVEELELHEE